MNGSKHNAPVFFLTSTETRPTLIPRKCWIIEKLWSDERQNNFLRVNIYPPILGQSIGIEQELIEDIVIATRHTNANLDPLSELPITVYVCHITNSSIRNTGKVSSRDLHIILIGEIYKTLMDAEKAIRDERMRI